MRADLGSVDWDNELKVFDTNASWNFCYEAMEKKIPRTKRNIPDKRHKPSWMNKAAIRNVKKKIPIMVTLIQNQSALGLPNLLQGSECSYKCRARGKA